MHVIWHEGYFDQSNPPVVLQAAPLGCDSSTLVRTENPFASPGGQDQVELRHDHRVLYRNACFVIRAQLILLDKNRRKQSRFVAMMRALLFKILFDYCLVAFSNGTGEVASA